MLSSIRAQFPLWRRALRRRRRTLAVLAAAIGVALLVPPLLPPGSQGASVVVADAELPAGTVLEARHLRTARVAAELAPEGSVRSLEDLVGSRTAQTIPSGAPLWAGMLEGEEPSEIPEGSVVMAVPVPEVLLPRLTKDAQLEILASTPGISSPARIPARVLDAPTVSSSGSVLEQGGMGQAQVVVSVDGTRSGDIALAVAEGWLAVSPIG